MHKIDLVGKKYGRWTVIAAAEQYPCGQGTRYLCRCDCGTERIIAATSLVKGRSNSCGCLKIEKCKQAARHGMARHATETGAVVDRLYNIWGRIKQRCTNPNVERYPNYGGRGIAMYEEWANDFQAFYDWALANGYQDDLQIDRIDNDGDYEPSNCRWVTLKENANNRRSSVFITYQGETKTASQWAEETGIKIGTLLKRYHAGWSVQDVLTK